jgi:hypothetical protein
MAKEELVKAIINGKTKKLSKAAYKIASRFFNAISEEDLKKARPAELERPLLRPTIKPVMIKPAIKEPEVKTPEMPAELQGDPMTEKVEETVESGGDPAAVVPGPSKSKRTPAKKAKK